MAHCDDVGETEQSFDIKVQPSSLYLFAPQLKQGSLRQSPHWIIGRSTLRSLYLEEADLPDARLHFRSLVPVDSFEHILEVGGREFG